ncbi:MAG: T9SS type A sorting domain-containing protein [Dinghuibacter sp.]|nr:T9SS type A sorting domain-containing protein [Dinghuibacter sp.]
MKRITILSAILLLNYTVGAQTPGETSSGNKTGESTHGNREGGIKTSDKHQKKTERYSGNRTRETGNEIQTEGDDGETGQGNVPGEQTHGNRVATYPNPVSGIITFTVPKNEQINRVQVFNLQGKQVLLVTGNRTAIQQMNMAALNPGNYISRVTVQNGTVYTKQIVKK